jgi:hypothetical protein
MRKQSELWVGLVKVRPLPNCDVLGAAKGAYFNLIAWAVNYSEFKKKAEILCTDLELFVEDVEESMPIIERQKFARFDDELQGLVEQAEGNPNAILYGTFHSWSTDDHV